MVDFDSKSFLQNSFFETYEKTNKTIQEYNFGNIMDCQSFIGTWICPGSLTGEIWALNSYNLFLPSGYNYQ